MKKLRAKEKERQLRKSSRRKSIELRRRPERKNAEARKKRAQSQTIYITAPQIFNFALNYEETVTCLRKYKRAIELSRELQVYIDLSKIKQLSLSGALVLASEIDRASRVRRKNVKPKNKMSWDPKVRRLLSSLGFFRLLGLNNPKPNRTDSENITVLPMVSTSELDREKLNTMRSHMAEVANILDQDLIVYEALVEAADNARTHAYPVGHQFEFTPIWRAWWATASWNPQEHAVKFIIYDQGVGIPETLPRWRHWERVRGFVRRVFGNLSTGVNDASKLIRAAVEIDRTSLGGGHGKGLQDIVEVQKTCPGASLRILSGRGSALYGSDGRVSLRDNDLHLGGTLVEWTIPVGARIGVVGHHETD